jgi:hypothetical protein
MYSVGDVVTYAPHECHALDRDAQGDYPWVMLYDRRLVSNDERGNPIWEQEELKGERVDQVLDMIRRHPNPKEERKKLHLVRPQKMRRAVVAAVNDDGTCNLDVDSHNGGVTLHYQNVKLDREKRPHTCH